MDLASSDGMEARKAPRTAFREWVEIACDGQRARGAGVDLSVDGLGVEHPAGAVTPGAALVSEFPLPGIALPLEVEGQWAWADREAGRAGIRFTSLDPGIADLLANFVAGRL